MYKKQIIEVTGKELNITLQLLADDDFSEFSLEELMNIEVYSASRKEENSFDSPFSTYVISSQEIGASGATSIPAALRLCPGLIVREIANGTYDVSIRGGVDGLPEYQFTYQNSTILVMIDNRPVYSSFQGGTYWANLPVGLAEIDRIEVVAGPVSPLFGPNAVSGVINIITLHPNENGNFARVNANGGVGLNNGYLPVLRTAIIFRLILV